MARHNKITLSTVPPSALVMLAVVSLQLGAALSTFLFPTLGAEGTVAVRIIISALLLCLVAGSRLRKFGQACRGNGALLLLFGICIAAMNFFFYKSIALIPLGAAVALEFIGPLGVAALTSRRLLHFAWVGLAAAGIFLLSPFAGAQLNTLGILYALLAGAGWALFIVLAARVGERVAGNDGLAIGMLIAAISMIPFALPVATKLVSEPLILLASLLVALLSTTIPFTLEFSALKRIPARTYGILVSVEPAVAAMVGAALLGERIGVQGATAVACVVVAAIGITITDGKTQPQLT